MGGTKFIFHMVEVARFLVYFFIPKVKKEMKQVLSERSDPFLVYLAIFFETDFHEFKLLCDSWIVYSWRRSTVTDGRCKANTSNYPFSRCRSVQQFGLQMKLTITEYSLTTSAHLDCKNSRGKNPAFGIASAWRNRAGHHWQRDNQDPNRLPHRAHETLHLTSACV